MGKVIWKFNFHVKDQVKIEMPKGAEILTVQNQYEMPTVWAIADPMAPKELRHFELLGTGQDIDTTGKKYIGTFQMSEGTLVWHLFEKINLNEHQAIPAEKK